MRKKSKQIGWFSIAKWYKAFHNEAWAQKTLAQP
ncbi:MAG: hypothetical protein GFGODING_02955 [Flavobacteriales bacterium]|nr:hypothetical protein [Flavobacteriales bacterium]